MTRNDWLTEYRRIHNSRGGMKRLSEEFSLAHYRSFEGKRDLREVAGVVALGPDMVEDPMDIEALRSASRRAATPLSGRVECAAISGRFQKQGEHNLAVHNAAAKLDDLRREHDAEEEDYASCPELR